jgi:hypothetical protein
MSERTAIRFAPSWVPACCQRALMCAALYLLQRNFDGAVLGALTYFLFGMFWRATLRKRALSRRGYFTGQRVGTHWVYDELQDGVIESIELLLDYAGRGEYDIHIPGPQDWRNLMPAWARDRREEIPRERHDRRIGAQATQDALRADSAQSPPDV